MFLQINSIAHTHHAHAPISFAGDAVEVKDYVTQEQTLIPLAGPANRQGRIAADNIAGRSSSTFRGSQGTSVLGLFGSTLAGTGASEKTLKRLGRPYSKVCAGSGGGRGDELFCGGQGWL